MEKGPKGKQYKEARYMAFILDSTGKVKTIDLGEAKEIEASIFNALETTEQGLNGQEKLWSKVSDLVISPLKNTIADKGTLLIFIQLAGSK